MMLAVVFYHHAKRFLKNLMVVSQDVDELTYFSNITFLTPQINIFFKSDSIPFAPIGCPNFMQNKTKYTMDPGIYFLMKTNK